MLAPLQSPPQSQLPMHHHSPWSATHTPVSASQQASRAAEIIPRLFISDLSFAESPQCLASFGITHVLSAMRGNVLLPTERPLRCLHLPLDDFPFAELAAHLPTSTAFLREALRDPNARVLVHCAQGISRSASVVAAFLIAQYGWPPAQAIQYVQSKRRIAEPNFGFVSQLHEYAASLRR